MNEETMFSRFGQALKEARLISGMSQEELALQSNIDRTYVSMLERGIKVPTLTTIAKICKSLNISSLQLISRTLQLEQHKVEIKNSKKSSIKPPFFGTSISCGKAITEDFLIQGELSLDEECVKKPEETFFIKASGDSMTPTIWDGDLLIVSFKKKVSNGSIVVANLNNEFTVKRFFKTAKGIKLVPENQNFNEINLNEDSNLILCGVVIGLVRNL